MPTEVGISCVRMCVIVNHIYPYFRAFAVAVALAIVSLSAGALSFGRSHGAVVFGSPIDLSFDVLPDAGRKFDASCLAVKLEDGSVRVPDGRVQVSEDQRRRIRVRSDISVNEPVLKVTLEGGCSGRVVRTYTFLVDLPGDAAVVDETARASVNAGQSVGLAELKPVPAAAPRAERRPRPKPARDEVSRRKKPASSAVAAPRSAPARHAADVRTALNAPGSVGGRGAAQEAVPKLVMESLDVWLDSPVQLQLSSSLSLDENSRASESVRTQSAEMWRVLNTPVQDLVQYGTRIGELETELRGLRAQLQTEKAAGLEARTRAERAESERYSATPVYALAGLLLLALAALVWQARRHRHGQAHAWQHTVAQSGGVEQAGIGPQTVWPESESIDRGVGSIQPSKAVNAVVLAGGEGIASADGKALDEFPAEADRKVAAVQAPVASVAKLRALGVEQPEDLFDVLQQADFFVSIGEHEQAIDGLRRHIAQNSASSPLAYLELLRLYHALGRAAAFDELSAGFERQFNATVPPFATFQREGKSLEDYPEALRKIENHWGTASIVGVLDALMFRAASARDLVAFELSAYEDLLLLLAIAQTVPVFREEPINGLASAETVSGQMGRAGKMTRSLDSMVGDLTFAPSGFMPVTLAPEQGRAEGSQSDDDAPSLHLEPGPR